MKVIHVKLEDQDHAAIKAQAALKGKTISQFVTEKLLKGLPAKKERTFGRLAGQISLPDDFFNEDPEITALFYGEEK